MTLSLWTCRANSLSEGALLDGSVKPLKGRLYQLIVDSAVRSKSDLLSVEFTMKAGDIENLTALPPGWFSRNAEVIGLKLREAVTDRTSGEASTILPFPSRKG